MKKRISIVLSILILFSVAQIPFLAMAKDDLIGGEKGGKNNADIIDIASNSEMLKTLVTSLKAADLVETLKGEGPFTVLAPTNAAFGKIPKEKLDGLLLPEGKDELIQILTTHVFKGKINAKDLKDMDGKEITMLSGEKLKVEVKDCDLYIGGSKVISPDIQGKNGVVHIIDSVIIP